MGNLFDIANIRIGKRDFYTVRQERIKREGSPYYTWTVPVTASTETSVIHVPTQFPDSRKYEPLDFIEVTNNDVVDLTLTINGGETFPVPAGVIRKVVGKALWHIAITNNGGVNSVLNKIYASLRREPMTIDKWAQRR